MENNYDVDENENKQVFVLELLAEIKQQSKRWFKAFIIMVAVEVLTIGAFIWYLYQYDFTSTIEQSGVYTLMDSSGNVVSSDIQPDQINEILEIINNGKDKGNQEQD